MSGYLSCVPSFAEIVLTARTERGLTQAQFARAVGVSSATVYEAERGGRPSDGTVAKVARYLGRSPSDLLPDTAVFRQSNPRKTLRVRSAPADRFPVDSQPAREGEVDVFPDDPILSAFVRLWPYVPDPDRLVLLNDAAARAQRAKAASAHPKVKGRTASPRE